MKIAEIQPAGLQAEIEPTLDSWVSPEEFFRSIRYVTLKLTSGCNLKCSYCNVEADVPSTPRMSIETFKRIADLYIPNSEGKEIGLEFHGGEPLILSDEWFEEAVGYAGALAKKHGKTMMHPMQTNGTKLTEERYRFLTDLGIMIGVSFDGTPEINDRYRMAGKQVEKAVKMIVNNKRGFGMIMVLSKANCYETGEIMEYFAGLGVPAFRINFLQPQGHGMDHTLLSGDEMYAGIKGIFDHMAKTECAVVEETVQTLVTRFVYGRSTKPALSCWELECQAGRTYCAINIEGDVFSCGTDLQKHQLGNIEYGFDSINTEETLCSLHHKDAWYARCFDCHAKRVCALGCPTSHANEPRYRDSECDYTRKFYAYLHQNPEKVYRVVKGLGRRYPDKFTAPSDRETAVSTTA